MRSEKRDEEEKEQERSYMRRIKMKKERTEEMIWEGK